MRISTLLALCSSAIVAGSASAGQMPSPATISFLTKATSKFMPKHKGMASSAGFHAPENKADWKPLHIKTFGWGGESWEPEDTYSYTYDTAGNVIREESTDYEETVVVTESEYNANNKLTSSLSKASRNGADFENYRKVSRSYDPIVTGLITENYEWIWIEEDKEWGQLANNYTRTVTRNADGNITEVTVAVLYEGVFDPTERLLITYGEDGKATTIIQEELTSSGGEFVWKTGAMIKDIVWEETDGQITGAEDLFQGNNRVKSCTVIEEDLEMPTTVEYAPDSESYIITMKATQGFLTLTSTISCTVKENGGYAIHMTLDTPLGIIMEQIEEMEFDDWGLQTRGYACYISGMPGDQTKEEQEVIGIVEYDADGFPATHTVIESFYDLEEDMTYSDYTFRAEYSDYVDVTAGASAIDGETASESEYYTFTGLRVKNPTTGSLLIRRQGSRTEKIQF